MSYHKVYRSAKTGEFVTDEYAAENPDTTVVESIPSGYIRHTPTLTVRSDGDWGVFCLQCSDAAQDFTYPCARELWTKPIPPAVLSER